MARKGVRSKEAHERELFEAFARVAGLKIDPGSIRSEPPPKPDIYCTIEGQPRYFELTRVAEPHSANAMGNLLAKTKKEKRGQIGAADSYDDRDDLRESIRRKRDKQYVAEEGVPVELLLYYDGVFHPPFIEEEWAQQVVDEEAPLTPWSRITVFDSVAGTVAAASIGKPTDT